jgi:hypothetical protein
VLEYRQLDHHLRQFESNVEAPMISIRPCIAASLGATVILVSALPLLDLARRDGWTGNLTLTPILAGYVFGGVLLGGMLGLWAFRRLNWRRVTSHQVVGLVLGLVTGTTLFSASSWPSIALAGGIFGLIGVAAASLYWLLDRTAS